MATYATKLRKETGNGVVVGIGKSNELQIKKLGNVALTSISQSNVGTVTVAADALAIPVTHAIVQKTTGADAEALTIVDGYEGQVININLVTDGNGDGTLTVGTNSTGTGWATVVFADAGDSITIKYIDDTIGWIIIGAYGLTAQPTITV
jgi:hypothetical protein